MQRLPGAKLLPEERADAGDQDAHSVPLPQLAGSGHPHLHSPPAGLPQVLLPPVYPHVNRDIGPHSQIDKHIINPRYNSNLRSQKKYCFVTILLPSPLFSTCSSCPSSLPVLPPCAMEVSGALGLILNMSVCVILVVCS